MSPRRSPIFHELFHDPAMDMLLLLFLRHWLDDFRERFLFLLILLIRIMVSRVVLPEFENICGGRRMWGFEIAGQRGKTAVRRRKRFVDSANQCPPMSASGQAIDGPNE